MQEPCHLIFRHRSGSKKNLLVLHKSNLLTVLWEEFALRRQLKNLVCSFNDRSRDAFLYLRQNFFRDLVDILADDVVSNIFQVFIAIKQVFEAKFRVAGSNFNLRAIDLYVSVAVSLVATSEQLQDDFYVFWSRRKI